MKKLTAIVAVIIVLGSAWLIYSKVTQARREAGYKTAMAPFQRDLPVGMSREQVKNYFDSRNIRYNRVRVGGEEADRFEIQIGTEP